MRLVCISDTHGIHRPSDVPDGDVLVFAGDMCETGTEDEVKAFREGFLDPLPHPSKIVVAGNHDWPFQKAEDPASLVPGAVYLQDGSTDVGGLKIHGSPWQPEFCSWAFNLPRGRPLSDKWAMIPEDADVVVTHGPPKGIMDRVYRKGFPLTSMPGYSEDVGCAELRDRIFEVRPLLHVFGHIHEHHGVVKKDGVTFANVSHMGRGGDPVVFDVDPGPSASVSKVEP